MPETLSSGVPTTGCSKFGATPHLRERSLSTVSFRPSGDEGSQIHFLFAVVGSYLGWAVAGPLVLPLDCVGKPFSALCQPSQIGSPRTWV